MVIRVTTSAGTVPITPLLASYTWSGSAGRCARSFDFDVAVSETDPNLLRVDIPLGSRVELREDDGILRFSGHLVQRKRTSGGNTMTHRCLDRGMYLSGNKGWYTTKGTAEAETRRICGDFGVPVGALAATWVPVVRKFAAVALDKIVATLYSKAAEATGKRYLVRFEGEALTVVEKPSTSGLVLADKVNLMSSAHTESIEKMKNSVAIYDTKGSLLRTVEDKGAVALYGLLQDAITQKKGEDAAQRGRAILADNGVAQSVTAECLGDTRLVSGEAVVVRQSAAGVAGLFWIDDDTHTWKNGQCFSQLTLNFRNLMEEQSAGTEVK